jgi:hypothetical protein
MPKKRRPKQPVYDRTYRTSKVAGSYWSVASKLLGRLVVVYMPETDSWKGGYLYGLIPGDDLFLIKWKKHGTGSTLPGIWRIHSRILFTGTRLLPVPRFPARLPQSTTSPKEDEVATRKTQTAKTKAASTKTKRTAKPAAVEDSGNGAKKTSGRTRGPDKLEGLSAAKKRNIAKLIYRERSKSPATSWPDIIAMVEDKYDWTLPGSMTGRRLLREFGPDDAEQAIIKQNKAKADKTKSTKTKPPKTTRAKKGAVVDEEEDEDLEDEDEELEDEEDLDEEEMDEDEDDEDEDEDEDEEEEPEPPVKARRVRVTKGRGKKANPSK